jgi:protein-S-isoprenylcysteine O-methyltransferase Ste14
MTHTEPINSIAAAGAEPEPAAGEERPPAVCVRNAGGAISSFDEIVTPHPVVAFLFRRRTLIVLLGVMALVLVARPQPELVLAGIVVAALAECWRIWAAGTIHKTEELTTGGPYAHVRHPLYLGSTLHAVAYCLMSGRWESVIFVVPVFCLLYGAAVTTEEAMLHKLFGERYLDYCRQVPRFIPRLRPIPSGHGQFSWRQVLMNKEYINIIWVLVLSGLFILRLTWAR